jgi:pimeloyl-ACP methyl ester carboxylesterase
LSLHSSWTKSDGYQRTVVESWQALAKAAGVPEMIIGAIFPWCFTPELYAERPDYIDSSARFPDRLKGGIRNSELLSFEGCAHAPLYQNVADFNQKTLAFLQRHVGAAAP